MKQLKYINSQGETVDFRAFDTQVFKAAFHDYEWEYDATSQRRGISISQFTKKELKYEMTVAVRGKNKGEKLNEITDVTEYDVINNAQGKLYWGDYYINCNIISSGVSPSDEFFGAEKKMEIMAPYPFWIRETSKSFYKDSSAEETAGAFLDYLYDYAYDYSRPSSGSTDWNVEHYAPSEFKMIVYGPCVNPRILINGYPYMFYDSVETGEYVVIDSQNNSILKYRTNGTVADLYDLRGKDKSVFEPIPGGNLAINWPGTFGFDITLYIERSEPRW